MPLLPLHDDQPTTITPVVTIGLIVACVLVFFWQLGQPDDGEQVALALGTIPAVIFGDAVLDPSLALVPAWATLLTALFLHGGLLHLGGNMLFL